MNFSRNRIYFNILNTYNTVFMIKQHAIKIVAVHF